ncbi:MAG: cell division protein FtsI [Lachnospiraceae bacterium]|nr:cell division protein FtsI [Lachnospiraceae bacterium]
MKNQSQKGEGGSKRKKNTRKLVKVNDRDRFQDYMAAKLMVFEGALLICLLTLVARIVMLGADNEEEYKRLVMRHLQTKYDSRTIPYRRGAIVDRNGTTLAISDVRYNIILDAKMLREKAEELDPTLVALQTCFNINTSEVRTYIMEHPESQYYILQREVDYSLIEPYLAMQAEEGSGISQKGIWFETVYVRSYPYDTLASDVIGFTTTQGGQYGLEEYYNDILCGSNGREYGYLSDENMLERTIVPAQDGYTLVTTLDAHIQNIVEENIRAYNEEYANDYREGEMGSDNTGVIIMEVDTGEILAMASYPGFHLSDPTNVELNLSPIYPAETLAMMTEEEEKEAVETLWRNFCISESYEPGSVCKTFTMAAALDAGVIHDGDRFFCEGYMAFGEGEHTTYIRCHNRNGDGELTLKQSLEESCNVTLMQIGQKLGRSNYLRYFRNFNFGLRTNIDLAGEMRTDSLVFTEDTMGVTELATSTFGQGYNVTMIETISAYCSLINGGYYYRPHMVRQIRDENGAVVENIEPVMLRQVVSESVSDLMIDYCIGVVEEGTGTYARPAGYRIGGKTGTAETSGDGKQNYVVSFMGFAPADDPQIAIYVVIDRPNAASQDQATRRACLLCRSILTDVLPYMHIFMTEELSEEEERELEERGNRLSTLSANAVDDGTISGNDASGDTTPDDHTDNDAPAGITIKIDPETGYAIDPLNGEYLDPVTGVPINPDSSILQNGAGESIGFEEREQPDG